MIIRRKFQFLGAIRIVLGIAVMLFTLLSLHIAMQRLPETAPFTVAAIEGVVSVLVFGSGLLARSKPALFCIDEIGFHFNLDSDEPKFIAWTLSTFDNAVNISRFSALMKTPKCFTVTN